MPQARITTPNGDDTHVQISQFYWQEWRTREETRRAFKASRQPIWVMLATWLLVALLGWSIFQSSGELEILEPTAEERQAYNEYIVGRLNQGGVLPEMKPIRPSALEVDQFYNKKVAKIWERALAQGKDYCLEDYFASMHQVVQACKEAKMPLYEGVARLGGWSSLHDEAIHLVSRSKQPYDEEEHSRLGKELSAIEEAYQHWYNTGVIVVPERPDVNWHWANNLGLWALLSYLKGMLVCALIFVARLKGDRYFNLQDEFRFGAKRFVVMVLGWPINFWIYPYQTNTALYARKLRLKAEFLRDKPRGYELSPLEVKHIECLALQSELTVGKIVGLIAEGQDRRRRKALTTVYVMMLVGLTTTSIARISLLAHPVVLMEVVSSFQQIDDLPDSRDGPENPTRTKASSSDWWALLQNTAEQLALRLVNRYTIENTRAGPVGIRKKIDHVPKYSCCFV